MCGCQLCAHVCLSNRVCCLPIKPTVSRIESTPMQLLTLVLHILHIATCPAAISSSPSFPSLPLAPPLPLSFPGDVIIDASIIDDGWMEGRVERTGQYGMLPSNYVQKM